jgi:hypothetical protein
MTSAENQRILYPSMPFGHIDGIEIGKIFSSRKYLSKAGVHAPSMHGIWGREKEGACSIVLSGGYEDDIDNLDYILYYRTRWAK